MKKSNNEIEKKINFSLYEMVWAKIGDFPYWPGWIENIKKNNTYEVYFFGEDTKGELDEKLILKWSNFEKLTNNITEINDDNKNLLFAIYIALNAYNKEKDLFNHESYIKKFNQKEKENIIKECFEFLNFSRENKNKENEEKKHIKNFEKCFDDNYNENYDKNNEKKHENNLNKKRKRNDDNKLED